MGDFREVPAYTFPVSKTFTGKVQFRCNGAASKITPWGTVLRGEVKSFKNERAANGLVANGDHAHVDADTPIGQPDQFKERRATAAAAAGVTIGESGTSE